MPEELRITRKQRWAQQGQRFGENYNIPASILIAAGVFAGNDTQYRYTVYREFGHHWSSEDVYLERVVSILGLGFAAIGGFGTYYIFPSLCGYLGQQLANLMDFISPETPNQTM